MADTTPTQAWPSWVENWVLPYVDDTALWPVLVALLGHVMVILVPLMLIVWRTGSATAGAVLAILLYGTASLIAMELRARRRPGALTVSLLLTWSLSFPMAWFCEQTGVL